MTDLNAILPYGGVGDGADAIRTQRDAEYDVVSRVTRLLRQAESSGDRASTIAAVHKNNQLWTLLATDLAHPANALPAETKAGLLSLAGFCLRHGHAILAEGGCVERLIDINLSVMKGLRGEVGG
jgi:flagellar protein FlaF